MLGINGLCVTFGTRQGEVDAVRGVDLHVAAGQSLGIVGESGSGKSVTCYSILRILDQGGSITAGRIEFDGINLREVSDHDMGDIRGREISMVFQNPSAALNPIRKVGKQIEDVLRQHRVAVGGKAKSKAISLLEEVRVHDPANRYHAYPFELSGGQCQRVVVALALACEPRLLIADEPTTGLDITTQKTVMDLIHELCESRGMGLMLITHDLGLASVYCDNIVVMKDGEVVEQGTASALFRSAQHAYTQRLVAATPHPSKTLAALLPEPDGSPPVSRQSPLEPQLDRLPCLQVTNLVKDFTSRSGTVKAVRDISFQIPVGGSLGLVGESGSGKSTTSAMIARLIDPTSGDILLNGQSLTDVSSAKFAKDARRAQVQMVFQDTTDSLNPRQSAEAAIAEPLMHLQSLSSSERHERVCDLARMVGLPEHLLARFPHQLSGGQKARVGIARALSVEPTLLILDEPTAALDVSIQAIVLNLLADLRARLSLTYLFVSHDLQVVRMLCDEVIVMREGQIEESGEIEKVMNHPDSAYTQALLDAAPLVATHV